jgi:hypothetical protein
VQIWEQYAYSVELKTLLEGNSYQMILEATSRHTNHPADGGAQGCASEDD